MNNLSNKLEVEDLRAGQGRSSAEDDVSLFRLLGLLLRRRYAIAAWTLGTMVLVTSLSIVIFPRTFTSEASFTPQGVDRSGVSALQAAAGQFGIAVPSGSPSESPQFYADLLRSREILRPILSDTFRVSEQKWGRTAQEEGTLLDLLDLNPAPEAVRREEGLQWLRRKAISTTVNRETGVVRLSVRTPWPQVSHRVAERLLALTNEFNLRSRQTQASAERAFVEGRLGEVQRELRSAEDELKQFLQTNRQFRNSPDLMFEYERLERAVVMRQQLVTSLHQSYESARIAEVRDTPVITVVEPPEKPVERDPRRLPLTAAIGLVLGTMLGISVTLGREMVGRSRENGDPDFEDLREVWQETVSDLRNVFRRSRT